MKIQEIRVAAAPIDRFREHIGPERIERALAVAREISAQLARRVVWNINTTAVGGGVAEMLPPLLGYSRSVGIDTRWIVIGGAPDFFRVTKRLHHALHGSAGDGSPLGGDARLLYEAVMRENADEIGALVRDGDIVILHDPQTAGLAHHLRRLGAKLIWRCHIGLDSENEHTREGWEFLRPYLAEIPAYVFSRQTYVPEICDHAKSVVIQPSIDAFSPKNQPLSEDAIRTILVHTGLVEGPPPANSDHGFLRDDGTPGRVQRRADIIRLGRAPTWQSPLVVQISRWDPLKDMQGVMEGFAKVEPGICSPHAELVLAGPNVQAVADDPEGAVVFDQVVAAWRALPQNLRDRIHLASLPTADVAENAAIVNALQRHATVVVQKSLQEGFGLTVTEAMWKARPVLASAVGGIQDQIEDGVNGVLLKDPRDTGAFADLLSALLQDPDRMRALGEAAQDKVRRCFLGIDHLLKYAALMRKLDYI